ncbi:MAG: S8 family serine peptidase [Bdellovibrionaceae bacterium]|nr:S8 family serine peptidase [Pseudobdellovibrionaceae bacterium]
MLIRKLTWTVLIILGLVMSVACQKKDDKAAKGIYAEDPAKIFSNRPASYGKFVALVRLQNPSLYEGLKTDQLKKTIDQDLLKAITAEQDAFIKALKAFNSDIVVLMRYKYIVNGLAIIVSAEQYSQITGMSSKAAIEAAQSFARPMLAETDADVKGVNLTQNNSALFIGTKYAQDKNIKGQGIRVGVIDTGIDYTHAMLGGHGDEAEYKAIDPNKSSSLFPNQKVVGGYDFVGTDYGSGSVESRIPKPDSNPLDEQGHGTHVAGTVAGIGDGVYSYDGIAPEAQLYALKVFGAQGGTSDEVVIAALEYSADPNGDGNIDDRLDVVNLSLGSSYGSPRTMYNLAIRNLTLGGTVVVAAAGNAGDTGYIVGAPSITDEALSVAASVDGMEHNWKFKMIEFHQGDDLTPAEFVEGAISKKISEISESRDKLVYIGIADKDLTDAQAAVLKGHAALIDRGGGISFFDKMRRAEAAGAVAVVMVNHEDGPAFIMGGQDEDSKIGIPAVMIAKNVGDKIRKDMMKDVDVYVQLKSTRLLEKPELIDTMADFSSRGPRGEDSLIKPEITAPGEQIISAQMGKGKATIPMSGTSMSGPHMTGVMALMKQFYPELSVSQLKSVVMGTSISLHDEKKQEYSVSRMGAGRVQVDKALSALVATSPASLSLGEVRVEAKKTMYKEINVTNVRPEAATFDVRFKGHPAISINQGSVRLPPKGVGVLGLKIAVDSAQVKKGVEEIDGFVQFLQGGQEVFRLPVLAVVRKISQLSAQSLKVYSTSVADSDGAMAELEVKNESSQVGEIVPMNLIAVDDRKYATPSDEEVYSKSCDIQAVGYKIVAGKIYFGFKMYQPVTTWHACELSVLFDADGDGNADQELAGAAMNRLQGLPASGQFASLLLDANIARSIRTQYELSAMLGKPIELNYLKSVEDALPMLSLNHSTIAVLVADIGKIRTQKATGKVAFKIASSSREQYNVESDDFLDTDEKEWRVLDLTPMGQSYIFTDLAVSVPAKSQKTLNFTKGQGKQGLMLLMPQNRSLGNSATTDEQLDIMKPSFQN